jgi:hypothetical protein
MKYSLAVPQHGSACGRDHRLPRRRAMSPPTKVLWLLLLAASFSATWVVSSTAAKSALTSREGRDLRTDCIGGVTTSSGSYRSNRRQTKRDTAFAMRLGLRGGAQGMESCGEGHRVALPVLPNERSKEVGKGVGQVKHGKGAEGGGKQVTHGAGKSNQGGGKETKDRIV